MLESASDRVRDPDRKKRYGKTALDSPVFVVLAPKPPKPELVLLLAPKPPKPPLPPNDMLGA